MMRSSNPALSAEIFKNANAADAARARGHVMTISGTVNKTGLLLAFVLASGYWSWQVYMNEGNVQPLILIGALGGLGMAILTCVKKQWAPITAPIYALLEGLFLGAISAFFNKQYPGIVIQAVALTLGTLACLLIVYKSGLIKVTENFKLGVAAATGGIFVLYFFSFIISMFGGSVSIIHGNGLVSIGLSIFVVIIAALNLVMDFDFIEHGAEAGAPKFMEWYGAFGLMVTLIWLYIEILRLLAKLQSR